MAIQGEMHRRTEREGVHSQGKDGTGRHPSFLGPGHQSPSKSYSGPFKGALLLTNSQQPSASGHRTLRLPASLQLQFLLRSTFQEPLFRVIFATGLVSADPSKHTSHATNESRTILLIIHRSRYPSLPGEGLLGNTLQGSIPALPKALALVPSVKVHSVPPAADLKVDLSQELDS